MKARIGGILGIGLLAGSCLFMGWTLHRESLRKKAEDQAVWMARVWEEGRPFEDSLREAGAGGGIRLSPDEWQPGEGADVALGPVVGGKRVGVRRDRTIHWRAVR